jgi:hypothetical protein
MGDEVPHSKNEGCRAGGLETRQRVRPKPSTVNANESLREL